MSDRVRGPAVWIATCAGVGYFPVAPGTAGSAVAIAITAGLAAVPQARFWLRVLLVLGAVAVVGIGVWAATRAEIYFGRIDPPQVVIDEVAGQFLTLAAAPNPSWKWLAASLVLFRVFDILKPFPARRAEKLSGGWGIMSDDLIAGAYGAAVVASVGYLIRTAT
ncbi:MAG: phosphatidylglycerophosphatase A [Acidobacteria bacterium]|nr:phosphatidylglycerophosphatase A [Acidobacteriota bacterium]